MDVKFVGAEDLEDEDVAIINKIVGREQKRLDSWFDGQHNPELTVDVKALNIAGKAKTFELGLQLVVPELQKGRFNVKESGWELDKILHKGLKALQFQIGKRMKE